MIFMGRKWGKSILKKFGKKSICSDNEVKKRIKKNYMLEVQPAEQYIGGEVGYKSSSKSYRSSMTS